MVESLSKIRDRCQKKNYKTVGNWYACNVIRDAALPITWCLLHTKITANQITHLSLILGALSAIVYALPGAASFFLASLLFQLFYLFDHVDGQIARYHGAASHTGRFYDFMMHHIVHGVVPFGLAWYVYVVSGSVLFIAWGFISSISIVMFNITHDTKYKTYFEQIDKNERLHLKRSCSRNENKENRGEGSFFKKGFSFIHKTAEAHVMMNILTVTAVLGLLVNMEWTRIFIFFYYGVTLPLLVFTKVAHIIMHQQIDSEFNERFEEK